MNFHGWRKKFSIQDSLSAFGYHRRNYPEDYSYSSTVNVREALKDLVSHLKVYDDRRVALEQKGGRVDDLREITRILNAPVAVHGLFVQRDVALTRQEDLRNALRDVDFDLNMQIRTARRLSSIRIIFPVCSC